MKTLTEYSVRVCVLATALAAVFALTGVANAAEPTAAMLEDTLERGKAIAFDRNAGNCLSCHMMDDGELPGNSAPPLLQMQLRFPDHALLRAQIWDATVRNPTSVMPPYGRNLVLSEEEIDLVVDYVLSL